MKNYTFYSGIKFLVVFLFCILLKTECSVAQNVSADSVVTTKIWDKAPYNSFPDIVVFRGEFYCSLREGNHHVDSLNSGTARIIKSKDGKTWKSVALLKREGLDLRDPKLSITPQGKLMVIMAGSTWGYTRKQLKAKEIMPLVSFSDVSGKNFSSPTEVKMDSITEGLNWIWRVTWNKGVGYGIVYHMMFNRQNEVFLLKTLDGVYFKLVSKLDVDGAPSEATIRFDKAQKMTILLRRVNNGVIIEGKKPFKKWTYLPTNINLGGPNFLFSGSKKMIMATRGGEKMQRTTLHRTNLKGTVEKTVTLPSGGDTGYSGMVVNKGFLWVVYYSTHEKKAAIYLSKVPLKLL